MIHETRTILLMEDNADDERLALRALRMCGLPLSVRVARDGAEALRVLGLNGSADGGACGVPDLVLSDLKMPKFSGDEVLRRARAETRLRDVPYVMFSSSDETSDVRRCLDLGATAYCAKPVGFEEYMACVGEVARRWLPAGDATAEPFCVIRDSELNQAASPEVP